MSKLRRTPGSAARDQSRLVDVDLGDHLTFRLIRSTPTGLGDNQPGVATRRYVFACLDVDHDAQIDTVVVDVVVGPPPIGQPEVVEPANRLHLRRPLVLSLDTLSGFSRPRAADLR